MRAAAPLQVDVDVPLVREAQHTKPTSMYLRTLLARANEVIE
jgi:hypothetical protein